MVWSLTPGARRPDVGEAERDWCAAQDVLADALLLGSGGTGRGRVIGEDRVRARGEQTASAPL